MWFQALLAAIGIVYEVLRCILCAATYLKKKSDPYPKGWTTTKRGWVCPRCGDTID